MSVPQKAVAWIKPEEYLALEEQATVKHEYLDGVIYTWQGFVPEAMAGGSRLHNQIIQNLVVALRQKLRDRPCQVYMTDVRLHVRARRAYFYPDVAVTCASNDRVADQPDAHEFSEPVILFEVLSDSTEAFDRGEKFGAYREIPTLMEYVLVSPREGSIEVLRRKNGWTGNHYPDFTRLESLNIELDATELFAV